MLCKQCKYGYTFSRIFSSQVLPYIYPIFVKHYNCFRGAGHVDLQKATVIDVKTLIEKASENEWCCRDGDAVKILTEILRLPNVHQEHLDTALKRCHDFSSANIVVCLLIHGASIKTGEDFLLDCMLKRLLTWSGEPDVLKFSAFVAAGCDMIEDAPNKRLKRYRQFANDTLTTYVNKKCSKDVKLVSGRINDLLWYVKEIFNDVEKRKKFQDLQTIATKRIRHILLENNPNIFVAVKRLNTSPIIKNEILLGFPINALDKLPIPKDMYPSQVPKPQCDCHACRP